ncbi:MAG: hypothetical protein C0598_03910 [Marinilabiliales bacterium]|nr:MAG: hypothetical protein C0598_03910 [Marinilabiliales bacterium]
MKTILRLLFASALFSLNTVNGQYADDHQGFKYSSFTEKDISNDSLDTKNLFLLKAYGDLKIFGSSTKSTYQIYFILPIAHREQSPVWLEIDCPEMIDYRFVHLDSENVFVAAQLNNSPDTITLNWTSWVLMKQHDYSGIPEEAPIPNIDDLPNHVKPWLIPTAAVQWEDPFIKNVADSIRQLSSDIKGLALRINRYVRQIPYSLGPYPYSCDAYYAMKWGNFCVGRAHTSAALFRANGIPCRILLNLPVSYSPFDHHWIVEYYIPDYGWVKVETTNGYNPYITAHNNMITFACSPEDEFSLFLSDNIESYWFASDPVFQHRYPNWDRGHNASRYSQILNDSSDKIDHIISLTDSVHKYFTKYQGIKLDWNQNNLFNQAKNYQHKIINHFLYNGSDSLLVALNTSLNLYRSIESNKTIEIFSDDFENGNLGWTHEGINDEWELGTPNLPGPQIGYSGNSCWGTDLNGNYENNSDNWLESPPINLNNLASAFLEVKLWNDVEDDSIQLNNPFDRLTIELSIDNGVDYFPITTSLGGVIDFNTGVPKVPGWSRISLDLSPYIDKTIRVRFHFNSNNTLVRPGSYIDDFRIYGMEKSSNHISENNDKLLTVNCYPNPASSKINIDIVNSTGQTDVVLFDLYGHVLLRKEFFNKIVSLDLARFSNGLYILKISNENKSCLKKIIKK